MRRTLVAALFLVSCGPTIVVIGNGQLGSVERPVTGVTRVNLAMPGDLEVRLGSPATILISGDENLLPSLTSTVSGNELTLGTAWNTDLRPVARLSYLLTVPTLTGIITSSSGDVTAPALTSGTLSLRTSSSGTIKVTSFEGDTLKSAITSSGNISVGSGSVGSQTIEVSSSGDVGVGGVQSRSADVTISSSGDVTLWVTERLEVTISSSGNVRYYGMPSQVNTRLTSSGTVQALGAK